STASRKYSCAVDILSMSSPPLVDWFGCRPHCIISPAACPACARRPEGRICGGFYCGKVIKSCQENRKWGDGNMKFAYLIMGAFDDRTDRAEIHHGTAQIIGVANLESAIRVAGQLQQE